jgi:ATP-dependent helicase/nuclease subunit A
MRASDSGEAMARHEPKDDDATARERALDATRSLIVQAPAGSGKTELLIQRFLALLAHVDRPERIVAMTFTRKAAAEMRDRIIGALRSAAGGPVTEDAGERRTGELAAAVLAQDARLGWELITHPARLQIQTIDALCAGVARQAPLTSKLGSMNRVREEATALYRLAAQNALRTAAADDLNWHRLLSHLDNDAEAAIAQLSGMLGRREQWLRELPYTGPQELAALRKRLEAVLRLEIEGELSTLRAAFPAESVAALAACERHAAAVLACGPGTADLADALLSCAAAGGLPAATVDALPAWRVLAGWLLTKDRPPRFRSTVNKNNGFPQQSGTRRQRKQEMLELLKDLAGIPGLADGLAVARVLPPPRYDDEAWALVASLAAILRDCTAELLLVFAASGEVDFPQTTLAALDALGEPEAPSELLLRLDRRLDHLLIDEFQDTSLSQFELIRSLTAGWQAGDGRTVFAVGDPMQSIYRFRQAEVRLFLEACRDGRIGDIPVERLTLSRNFRSRPGIVRWVNETFPVVIGAVSDPWRSAVAFSASIAARNDGAQPGVTVDITSDASGEAAAVISRIEAARASGARRVGVLVRARTHLEALLPALRAARVPYVAVELDALGERQAVIDLVSLTHALAQPADGVAWLSVLRAPWCGLDLEDLFSLVGAAKQGGAATLADVLGRPEALDPLSRQGRLRMQRAGGVLAAALAARGRSRLSARVRGAWLALGGPACVQEAIDLDATERYFALLAEHERGGDVDDWPGLLDALRELRALPSSSTDTGGGPQVSVMTLHRAKGLQFDTVILPGLTRPPGAQDAELLRWRRRPAGVLIAPSRARGAQKDPLYEYLKWLERDEEDAELARLIYVGCTRARETLHLVAVLGTRSDGAGWKLPPERSALGRLWPVGDARAFTAAPHMTEASGPPRLSRLASGWMVPEPVPALRTLSHPEAPDRESAPPFDWAHETARRIGVVGHRLLRQIAEEGVAAWPQQRLARLHRRLVAELAHEGVSAADVERAAAELQQALQQTLGDARGRWLLESGHGDPRSECAVSALHDRAVVDLVMDRTFIDTSGVRWIIDFKFSRHGGAEVEAFLDNERERYREQLERYAGAMRAFEKNPIRLGLYFPFLSGWREWSWPT